MDSELYKKISSREHRNILRNNILMLWLNNTFSMEELAEKTSVLGIETGGNWFKTAVVKVLFANTVSGQDKSLMCFAVSNICGEILQGRELGISFCDYNGDVVLFMLSSTHTPDEETVRQVLEDCAVNIKNYLDLEVFITAGSTQKSADTVYQSYSSARSLQEYFMIYPYGKIISQGDVPETPLPPLQDAEINSKAIMECILRKDRKNCLDHIDEMYGRIRSLKCLTPSYLQNFTIEILMDITGTLRAQNITTDTLFSEFGDLFSQVFRIRTADGILDWLKGIAGKCIGLLEQQQESISPFIKKVVADVHTRYSEDINLKTLSIEYNISAPYLGQLFKTEIGETFTNYLNNIRIEKSKEILKSTSLTASEISKKVGYANPRYFFTIFKKAVGISPSEYKEGKLSQ